MLFESAADAYGPAVIGVILTGANPDGAHGLRKLGEAGGIAIVEDPAHAYAKTMPEEALKACPTADVMKLGAIAAHLSKVCAA